MLDVLAITAPLYLLIGLGYGLVHAGVLDAALVRALGRYAVLIAIPALLFNTVSQRPIADVLNVGFLAAYAMGSVAVLLLGFAYARRVRTASPTMAATMSMGMSLSNTGYIGLPIAMAALGPSAAGPVAMAFLVENLLMIPLAIALVDLHSGRSPAATLAQAMRNLVRNPLLASVALGLVAALVSLQLPEVLQRPISLIAASATPVALIAIGGTLVGMRLDGVKSDLAAVAAGKLVLHPLAVAAAMAWLLTSGDQGASSLQLGGVLLASMPMFGIYPLLTQRWGHERFAAAALLFTMAVSFVSINLTLWLLQPAG